MSKRRWNFVFAETRDSRGLSSVGIPGIAVALCAVVIVAGLCGFARVAYLGSSYALAVYNATEARRENDRLKVRIESLERFVSQETAVISDLATYEDNARLKYGLNAISSDVRKAGVGGFPSRDDILYSSMLDPLTVKAESLRLQAQALNYQAELQETTFSDMSGSVQRVHSALNKRPAIWPANGRLTSTFGYRNHPFTGLRLLHEGLDIANSIWTPIHASADGLVTEVNSWTHFGNMVKITHDSEYTTLYGHMQKQAVTNGQFVKRGDVIGYIGNTGRSTGPHLHYEVHKNGRSVDPMGFIVAGDQIVD
ncbi:MAG: M23 family metallopeptidase [Chitinispirillales bacterium]|jgi:murein DD-endopeptidase MepM/ murein hydrolase activator NlpD|nr:M23 family metallopeptidase [Chitinispirillales bacterium]